MNKLTATHVGVPPPPRAGASLKTKRLLRDLIVILAFAIGSPVSPAESPVSSYFTLYLLESFPKQTITNKQIQQINDSFGTSFEDWNDVHNLSLGAQYFARIHRYWRVGIKVDYSRGSIEGEATVPTFAGPATLAYEQKYDISTDLCAVVHFLPCLTCTKVIPFIYGGGGIGYEKDRTTLSLRNELLDEWVQVDNDGWFPTFAVGLGIDVPLTAQGKWYVEFGGAYAWARLRHYAQANGTLPPTTRVIADTDFTGPNYWVGIGLRI